MKKSFSYLTMTVLLVLVCLTIISCGDDVPSASDQSISTEQYQANLPGTWKYSVTDKRMYGIDLETGKKTYYSTTENTVVTINSNGTGKVSFTRTVKKSDYEDMSNPETTESKSHDVEFTYTYNDETYASDHCTAYLNGRVTKCSNSDYNVGDRYDVSIVSMTKKSTGQIVADMFLSDDESFSSSRDFTKQ